MATRRKMATQRKWKLEDAKNRFSELVRAAQDQGPQRVTTGRTPLSSWPHGSTTASPRRPRI